jgi:hypothetical protein
MVSIGEMRIADISMAVSRALISAFAKLALEGRIISRDEAGEPI